MADWFFDRQGQAQIFLYEGDRFISRNGRNLGWALGSNVYSLIGMPIGWYEDGILYDKNNSVIAFKLNRTGNLATFSVNIGKTPELPGIPRRPGMPGLSLSGKPTRSRRGGWSSRSLQEMFMVNFR